MVLLSFLETNSEKASQGYRHFCYFLFFIFLGVMQLELFDGLFQCFVMYFR